MGRRLVAPHAILRIDQSIISLRARRYQSSMKEPSIKIFTLRLHLLHNSDGENRAKMKKKGIHVSWWDILLVEGTIVQTMTTALATALKCVVRTPVEFSDADMPDALITRKSIWRDKVLGDKLVKWMSKKRNKTNALQCLQQSWRISAIAISCNPVQTLRTGTIHTRYTYKGQVKMALWKQLKEMYDKGLKKEALTHLRPRTVVSIPMLSESQYDCGIGERHHGPVMQCPNTSQHSGVSLTETCANAQPTSQKRLVRQLHIPFKCSFRDLLSRTAQDFKDKDFAILD
ncbi:hypothetical protein Tco_0637553 [Tanacetum coccineum]